MNKPDMVLYRAVLDFDLKVAEIVNDHNRAMEVLYDNEETLSYYVQELSRKHDSSLPLITKYQRIYENTMSLVYDYPAPDGEWINDLVVPVFKAYAGIRCNGAPVETFLEGVDECQNFLLKMEQAYKEGIDAVDGWITEFDGSGDHSTEPWWGNPYSWYETSVVETSVAPHNVFVSLRETRQSLSEWRSLVGDFWKSEL